MPSPFGHALCGVGVAWTAGLLARRPVSASLAAACAVAAVLPDVDLVLPIPHRTVTHSVTAVAVSIIAVGVTGWVIATVKRATRGAQVSSSDHEWWVAVVLGAAWASHLLCDWLGVDRSPPYGIQMLWPASHQWFYSAVDLFPATERRRFFSAASIATNARAVAQEFAVFAPVLGSLWWVRRKA